MRPVLVTSVMFLRFAHGVFVPLMIMLLRIFSGARGVRRDHLEHRSAESKLAGEGACVIKK